MSFSEGNNETINSTLQAEVVAKGLKTLGMHPLVQKHTFLELSLSNQNLQDIELLRNYPLVMYLDISNNQIESLQPLEQITALIHLKARSNQIKECLQYFPPICNERQSWGNGHSAVGSMLTLVDLSDNQITQLANLSNHPFLECLLLSKNQISHIEGLKNLLFLQTLDLSFNLLTKIENLVDLPIRELNLAKNQITSLEGIQSMKYITSLNISGNLIFSLEPLQYCVNLTYLDISENAIQFIRQTEYLSEIPWLQVLVVKGNPATRKAHYRFRTIYRLPNLQRLDDISVSADEKIRANNLYKSAGGDLSYRRAVHEQISPNIPFIDFTPQQLDYDEEQSLSIAELNRNPFQQ